MNDDFTTAMRRSLERTRSGDLKGATRLIQDALSGRSPSTAQPPGATEPLHETIEDAEIIEDRPARRTLRQVISGLRRRPTGLSPRAGPRPAPPDIPGGASFDRRSYSGSAGSRDYWLYIPSKPRVEIRGVIMMLHGCTQTPEDFAVGTGMSAQAERHGFVVIYPEQTARHNSSQCWNWFRTVDQGAGAGEPAILAGLAGSVAREFGLPDGRVFVAGLSAGGAMAAILGTTHPELFGAVGIHSGLAAGSAHDVVSAFAAMRGEPSRGKAPRTPTIVFHGLADKTVAAGNATAVIGDIRDETLSVSHINGRSVRQRKGTSAAGHPVELWQIEGAGHAWSGGSPAGSYADPTGPDASGEMLRFFAAQFDD